jgi:hypothetical protein
MRGAGSACTVSSIVSGSRVRSRRSAVGARAWAERAQLFGGARGLRRRALHDPQRLVALALTARAPGQLGAAEDRQERVVEVVDDEAGEPAQHLELARAQERRLALLQLLQRLHPPAVLFFQSRQARVALGDRAFEALQQLRDAVHRGVAERARHERDAERDVAVTEIEGRLPTGRALLPAPLMQPERGAERRRHQADDREAGAAVEQQAREHGFEQEGRRHVGADQAATQQDAAAQRVHASDYTEHTNRIRQPALERAEDQHHRHRPRQRDHPDHVQGKGRGPPDQHRGHDRQQSLRGRKQRFTPMRALGRRFPHGHEHRP